MMEGENQASKSKLSTALLILSVVMLALDILAYPLRIDQFGGILLLLAYGVGAVCCVLFVFICHGVASKISAGLMAVLSIIPAILWVQTMMDVERPAILSVPALILKAVTAALVFVPYFTDAKLRGAKGLIGAAVVGIALPLAALFFIHRSPVFTAILSSGGVLFLLLACAVKRGASQNADLAAQEAAVAAMAGVHEAGDALYKTVPGPQVLVLKKSQLAEEAMAPFAEILQREAVGGWEYHSMDDLTFAVKKGLIGRLLALLGFGSKFACYVKYYMLIFKKNED